MLQQSSGGGGNDTVMHLRAIQAPHKTAIVNHPSSEGSTEIVHLVKRQLVSDEVTVTTSASPSPSSKKVKVEIIGQDYNTP